MTNFRNIVLSVILAGNVALLSACQPKDTDTDEGVQDATFSIHLVDNASFSKAAIEQAEVEGRTPPGTKYFTQRDGGGLIVRRGSKITQDCLLSAAAGKHPQGNDPIINFSFDETCTKAFALLTSENVGKQFAVVLNGEIISAPRINSTISGGAGFIEGGFTVAEAKSIATHLNAAAKRN